MRSSANALVVAIALGIVSYGSELLAGNPRKEAAEAGAARRDAREERKEAREATRHGAPDAREERKEAREATKEAVKETKQAVEARHKRQHELAEKSKKAPLSDKDKEELAKIRAHQRDVHRDAVERWAARRSAVIERRRASRRELIEKLGELPKRPKVREELTLHARRTAYLARAQHLAEVDEKPELSERIAKLQTREDARHTRRMDVLKGEK